MLVFGYNLSYIELFASIFSFASVILATRNSIWNWPMSIIGQVLFFILFLQNKLFGQAFLQIYFTIISIYGWIYWGKHSDGEIKILSIKKTILCLLLILVFGILGSFLLSFLQKELVILDSTAAVSSIIAIYLLSKRYFQAWILWIYVDLLYILLFSLKGIYLISFEYILITIMAIYGLINWWILYKKQIEY